MPDSATTFGDLVVRARDVLQDTGERWKDVELCRWVNESQQQIANLRPDTCAFTACVNTVEGAKQTIGSLEDSGGDSAATKRIQSAWRLISVESNNEPSHSLVGRRSIQSTTRKALTEMVGDWETTTGGMVRIEFYVYDVRIPLQFWLYPAPAANQCINVVLAERVQVELLADSRFDADGSFKDNNDDTNVKNAPIFLDDQYAPAMLDWVLYRCWSKDAEDASSQARAAMHLTAFNSAITDKSESDGVIAPKVTAGIVNNIVNQSELGDIDTTQRIRG